MGILIFLIVLLIVADMWLYMEIRTLRRRTDDMEENVEITWTWCDTHAKEHIRLNDRMNEIEQGLDLDPDALGRADREERLFFDGINNILNYNYDQARKAAADE